MTMKLMGWAIALAAIGLTPASLAAQTPPRRRAAGRPRLRSPPAPQRRPRRQPLRRAAAAAAAAPAPSIDYAAPTAGIGMPDGRKGIQDQVTEIGRDAAAFHNGPLLMHVRR